MSLDCARAKTCGSEFSSLGSMLDLIPPIDPKIDVDSLMRRRPGAIGVFVRRRMLCPGCAFARFHTIEDACQDYGVDLDAFLNELADATSGRDTASTL